MSKKEIEESMLKYKSDIAIHSMKDVPIKLPAGLVMSVITKREDPHDALISKSDVQLADLPKDHMVTWKHHWIYTKLFKGKSMFPSYEQNTNLEVILQIGHV